MVTGLIIVYTLVMGVSLVAGIAEWHDLSYGNPKTGARLVLFCWAWPALIAVSLVSAQFWLWPMKVVRGFWKMLKEMREELK